MRHWLKSRLPWQVRGSSRSSPDTELDSVRYVVFDTELTSLDRRSNRLLSIGAVVMEGSKIKVGEQFYRVVNSDVHVPAETVVIHRLRSEDLKRGEPLTKTLEDFGNFIAGAVLVGHFVNIDLEALRKEMGSNGSELDNPAVDTARVHRWIIRHGDYSEDLSFHLERLDLTTLAKYYRLEMKDAHHALSDAFLTAELWQRMIYVLQMKGIRKLKPLLRIARI